MRYFNHQVVVRMLDRVQARLVRSRSGSVLILVVVLVVLLALMGTALLNTTKGDRSIAAQHSVNTQIDLIVEGVKEIAKSAIAADDYDAAHRFRPAWDSSNAAAPSYGNWDSPVLDPTATTLVKTNDLWLAPRLPMLAEPVTGSNPLRWASITALPGMTEGAPGIPEFDSPFAVAPVAPFKIDPALRTSYITRVSNNTLTLVPNYVKPEGFSKPLPAWFFPPVSSDPYNAAARFVLAADADGDGIADSGFVKAPFGPIDGITYYYAVRIIDNSSAVNINTALSRVSDFKFPGSGVVQASEQTDALGEAFISASNNLGMFRSHVGLLELLNPSDPNQQLREVTELLKYRFNNATAGFATSTTVVGDGSPAVPRPDMTFITQGDLLEHQLARRLENPGSAVIGTSQTALKAFGLSDASALAYHFTLTNRDTAKVQLDATMDRSAPVAEFDSLFRTAATYRDVANKNKAPARTRVSMDYPADKIGWWLYGNFNWTPLPVQSFGLPGGNSSDGLPTIPANPPDFPSSPTYNFRSPIRSIVTSHNPVSTYSPVRVLPMTVTPAMAPFRTPDAVAPLPKGAATKTNINTARFEELWRAFWCVMAEETSPTGTPFTAAQNMADNDAVYAGMKFGVAKTPDFASDANSLNPQRMFRSSLRDPRTNNTKVYFESRDQLILRAAAAATNAMQMRNPNKIPAYQTVNLPIGGGSPGSVSVTVFPSTPQPFITEVFVLQDTEAVNPADNLSKNTAPYIAFELFNPFDVPIQLNSNWKIKYMPRDAGGWAFPLPTEPQTLMDLPTYTLQPGAYMVFDNYSGSAAVPDPKVLYYPVSSKMTGAPAGLAPGSGYISRIELANVLGNEMIITHQVGATPDTEQAIDSFDFTGINPVPVASEGFVWHYVRPVNKTDKVWQCVYPGRYDGTKGDTAEEPRHQGTHVETWATPGDVSWGIGDPINAAPVTLGADNEKGNVPGAFQIQLPPTNGMPGPNPIAGSTNKFPFGGFARQGDILQVPFIAAYTVYSAGSFVDMNSISMDAAFAEDVDVQDDDPDVSDRSTMHEQIGRFCPIRVPEVSTSPLINDFDDTTAGIPLHRYAWARDLFDYLTVQSPASDYLPNVSPDTYQSMAPGAAVPDPVANSVLGAAQEDGVTGTLPEKIGIEDTVPVQGLININTAPWIVLSAIPWMPAQNNFTFNPATGEWTSGGNMDANGNPIDDNIDVAKAIAYWRDGDTSGVAANGPFKSIFDLYKVEVVTGGSARSNLMKIVQKANTGGSKPGKAHGDFTPLLPTLPDQTRYDFEEQYSLMTKVSNLLTTRSDSFTVYILVQGWRLPPPSSDGEPGPPPALVVQRRAAFIQDRSTVTANNPTLPAAVNVPND